MSSPSDWFEPDETAQPTAAIETKAEPSLKDKIKARKAKAEAVEAQPVTEQPVDDVQSEELPL